MIKLTRAQKTVLALTSAPMAAIGIAGGVASYFNFARILTGSGATSLVLAGEGATLTAALVMLSLTLMGQHSPAVVRAALWMLPIVASGAGAALAPDFRTRIVMGVAPLAMTVAGEGITLVARRVVRNNTGVDLEAQRRAGLLVWHANRAKNGGWLARRMSKAAVFRLTKQFAASDTQTSVQVDDIQRYHIGSQLDGNLLEALTGTGSTPVQLPARPVAPALSPAPLLNPEALTQPSVARGGFTVQDGDDTYIVEPVQGGTSDASGEEGLPDWMKELLTEAEVKVDASLTESDLITAAQVAERLGHPNTNTIRSWVHRGKLTPVAADGNGRNLFSPIDVDRLG